MKCRNFSMRCTKVLCFLKAAVERKTLHIVNERSKSYQMESCIVSRNNTGIRINISFLSASTLIRECVPFSCFDILQNWRLSLRFDLEFEFCCFEVSSFSPSNPKEELFFFSSLNPTRKTLILKQKFGIKCQQSEKHIIWVISKHLSIVQQTNLAEMFSVSGEIKVSFSTKRKHLFEKS